MNVPTVRTAIAVNNNNLASANFLLLNEKTGMKFVIHDIMRKVQLAEEPIAQATPASANFMVVALIPCRESEKDSLSIFAKDGK